MSGQRFMVNVSAILGTVSTVEISCTFKNEPWHRWCERVAGFLKKTLTACVLAPIL